jgi:ribosomal protein S10
MKVKLTFRSEDVRALDSFIRDVVTAARKSGGKVCGPVPLPTRMTDTSPKADSYLGSLVKGRKIGLHLRALTIEGFEAGSLGGMFQALHKPEAIQVEIG